MSTISTVSNKAKKKKILTSVFQLLDQQIQDSILLTISLNKMEVCLKCQTAIPRISYGRKMLIPLLKANITTFEDGKSNC